MSEEIEALPLPLEQVAEFLPEALRVAITAYHERAGCITTDLTAKAYTDHHKACQAAIAHIELLVKLALRAHLPDADTDANRAAMTAELLRAAVADVKGFEE